LRAFIFLNSAIVNHCLTCIPHPLSFDSFKFMKREPLQTNCSAKIGCSIPAMVIAGICFVDPPRHANPLFHIHLTRVIMHVDIDGILIRNQKSCSSFMMVMRKSCCISAACPSFMHDMRLHIYHVCMHMAYRPCRLLVHVLMY